MRVLAVVPGRSDHGVVRHGKTVARLLARSGARVTVARGLGQPSGTHDVTHVQFTDALFGSDIASAASAFVEWAESAPRPLVVTLHDVPGLDVDRERDRRRSHGYRRVVAAADAVVVSAQHEAACVRALGRSPLAVVPLPMEPMAEPSPPPSWADRASIGVLGFVYPGKGHADVLRAAPPGAFVVAVGGASPGHEGLVLDLRRQADRLGVDFLVTGLLPEAELHAATRATTVPVAAYRTLGASASLATWMSCGRRPLVTGSPYAHGVEDRWPGSLLITRFLPHDLELALEHPGRTWLAGPPPRPEVAEEHLAVYRSCLA